MTTVFWILAAAAAAGVVIVLRSISTGRHSGRDRWAPVAGMAALAVVLIINAGLASVPDSVFGYRAGQSHVGQLIYVTLMTAILIASFAGLLFIMLAVHNPVRRRITAGVCFAPIAALLCSCLWSLAS